MMRRHWIFDLDGTLTLAVHDFDALKRDLGLPPDLTVLDGIARFPERAQELHARVRAWEAEHVSRACAAPDAVALLERLHVSRCRLGVLTRNTRETALSTLARTGLGRFFDEELVVGRDDATPKPHPDGVLSLLDRWRAAPHDAVMVGDYVDDIHAGAAAGVATVLVDRDGTGVRWYGQASRTVRALDDLLTEDPLG